MENAEYTGSQALTLNLNSKTVILNSVELKNNGTMTVNGNGRLEGTGNSISTINNYGTLTLGAGTISATKYKAIYNQSAGKVTVSGATLQSSDYTIHNIGTKTDSIKILSGNIESSNKVGIYNGSTGTVIVGNNETPISVSVTSPCIIGKQQGIYVGTGKLNFYDGIIKGAENNSISGTVTVKPNGYTVVKYTEKVQNIDYEVSVLGPSPPVVTAKYTNSSGSTYPGNIWTNKDLYVSLSSSDVGSGIDRYEWFENGEWVVRELSTTNNVGTITYTVTRDETLRFRAVDKNGIVSAESSLRVKVDKIAPKIMVSLASDTTATKTKKITITTEETGGSGLSDSNSYQYYLSSSSTGLSNGAWTDYTIGSEFTIGTGITGTRYLFVKRISDIAGNVSTSNGTSTNISGTNYQRFGSYVFDNTPPKAIINTENMYVANNVVTRLDGVNNGNGSHNSSATTWSDISGNNKNGTITGASWGDNYLDFNGTSTWVNLGVMNSNVQTIETTFSTDKIPTSETNIIGNWESGGGGIYIDGNGYICGNFYIGTKYEIITSPVKVVVDMKYHTVITFDGTKVILYVNGVEVGRKVVSGNIVAPGTTVMALGTNPSGTKATNYFDGKIFSAAVYNSALTSEQVKTNAIAGKVLAGGPTNANSITYTIRFNEKVSGFTTEDITVQNGTKGAFTTITDGILYTVTVTTGENQNNTQQISIAGNSCTDQSGNGNTAISKSVVIDRIAPTVTLSNNGGTYDITPENTTCSVSTSLTSTDTGSGVAGNGYAWATSNTTEATSWSVFKNGNAISSNRSGGNSYIWTNVIDNAGNRAETVKVSNAFTVRYKVVFDANLGISPPSEQYKLHGTNLSLTTSKPTRTGYTFKEWNTNSNGTGTSYSSGGTYTANSAVKLYAIWTPNDYTITWDKNYLDTEIWKDTYVTSKYSAAGTTPTSKTNIEDNSVKYGKYIEFTMPAGTSSGPYYANPTSLTVGNTYTWSVFVKCSSNKTLKIGQEQGGTNIVNVTQEWKRFTYTFTATQNNYKAFVFYLSSGSTWSAGDKLYVHSLELMEGTPTNSTSTKTYATKLGTLNTPTRTGYTFLGWYTEPSGGTQISATTDVPAENTTYYAHWKTNTYTVTYDYSTNGGTSASKTSATVYYGTTIDLTPTATRDGWTFVGWGDSSTQKTKLTTKTIGAGNITVYAIYSKVLTGTFKYYNNQTTTKTVTIYNKETSGSITSPEALGTPSEYSFRHWSTSTSPDSTATVAVSTPITISENKTYYASYQKTVTGYFYYCTLAKTDFIYSDAGQTNKTSTAIKYMGYTGTVKDSNFTIPTEVTSSNGGASAENYIGISTSTGSVTTIATPTTANTNFYAVYTEDLTLYYFDGTSHNSKNVKRRMLSNGSKYSVSLSESEPVPTSFDGSTFLTWSYDYNYYGESYRRTPLATGVNVLYAIYSKSITGTFNYHNGITGTSTTASAYRYYVSKVGGITTFNTNYTIPNVVKENRTISSVLYTYRGVSTASAGNATIVVPTTQNTVFYASYTYTITVSYNGNNSTGGSAPANGSGTGYMNYEGTQIGISVVIPSNSFVKTGYTFDGWNSNNSGSGTAYTAGTSYTFKSSAIIYAKWQVNKATIIINMNGGSLSSAHGAKIGSSGNYVTVNNSTTVHTIDYGTALNGDGLANMNNSGYINIVRSGYHVDAGAEYNTKADGSGTTYNQTDSYTAANFADISTESKTVELYVNWKVSNYQELNNSTTIKYYDTLTKALAGVTSGNTIKVLNSRTESTAAILAAEKTVTLDKNGKTITMSNVTITNNGTLTISGTGTITGSGARTIDNSGTGQLVISGGTIESTSAHYAIYNTSTKAGTSTPAVKVTSGTIESRSNVSIYNNSSGMIYLTGGIVKQQDKNSAIVNGSTGTIQVDGATIQKSGSEGHSISSTSTGPVVVTSGTIESATACAIISSGNITISGGTISKGGTIGGACVQANGSATAVISGGTIQITENGSSALYNNSTNNVTISNNAIIQNLGTGNAMVNNTTGTFTINGGTISNKKSVCIENESSGNINITGGTISSAESIGVYISDGTLTIGNNSNAVNITAPSITGGIYGVQKVGGTFNFYDGILAGKTAAIYGTPSGLATNCVVVNQTKTINSESYKTAVLGPSAPVITAKYGSSTGATYTSGTWTNQNIYVTVESVNTGAGVSQYEWKQGSTGTWARFDSSRTFNTEINSAIYFRLKDTNGTYSVESNITIKIDKTPPTVIITRSDYNTFSWTASDTSGITGYIIKNDDGTPTSWTTTGTLTSGTQDVSTAKKWYVWAKDAAGNSGNDSIESYTISRTQNSGTTLTTRYDSDSNNSGTAFTSSTVMLEGTPIWAKAVANPGYSLATLKHGSTALTATGEKFYVSKTEAIISSATENRLIINPNGGTYNGSTSNTIISQGSQTTYSVLNNPTRAGYTFNGWTLSGKGTYTAFDSSVTPTSTTTVNYNSASSTLPNVYNNSGGGTVTNSMVADSTATGGYSLKVVTNGTAGPGTGGISLSILPTEVNRINVVQVKAKIPTGYKLVAQGVDQHYTGYGSATKIESTAGNTGTGNWVTYNIIYYEGNTGGLSDAIFLVLTGTNNTSVTWYINSIVMKSYTRDQFKSIYKFGEGDGTLTANWNVSGSRIQFNTNGGAFDTTKVASWKNGYYNATASVSYRYYTYNTAYATAVASDNYDFTPNTRVISRTGYTFTGWYTEASGGTKIFNADGTLVKSVSGYSDSSGNWIKYDANVIVYARWTANTYTVNYNANAFATTSSKTINGLTMSYDATTSILTINGTWTSTSASLGIRSGLSFASGDQYDITLTYQSGSYTSTSANIVFVLDFQKDGENYNPRYAGIHAKSMQYPTSGTTTDSITVGSSTTDANGLNFWMWNNAANTTKFTNYRVKINVNKKASKSIAYDANYTFPANPVRVGYTFKGWYTAETGGTQVTSSTKMTTASNHTLYAQWNKNTGTIYYYPNGGSVNSGFALNTSGTYNGACTTTTAVNFDSVSADIYNCLTLFSKTGYKIASDAQAWRKDSATSTTYINQANQNFSTYLSNNTNVVIKLYANWTANTYTVAFNPDGGTVTTTNKTVTYNSTYGTLPTPTRDGYSFDGWYNLKDVGTVSLTSPSTSNYTYQEIATQLYPEITYIVTMISAEKISGSATEFSTVVYDFTNRTNLGSVVKSFGNNLSYTITCPSTATAGNDIKLLIYSGKAGSTSGNVTKFTGVKVSMDSSTTETKYTSTSTVSKAYNHTLFAKWKSNNYQNVNTSVYYVTLAAAVEEANSENEIKVLKNTTESTNASIASGKNITLSLNSKTITFSDWGYISNFGTLTISNSGNIVSDTSVTREMIYNSGTLTINTTGGTPTLTMNGANNCIYNKGTITSSAIIQNMNTSGAKYGISSSGSITINGGKINCYSAAIYQSGGTRRSFNQ